MNRIQRSLLGAVFGHFNRRPWDIGQRRYSAGRSTPNDPEILAAAQMKRQRKNAKRLADAAREAARPPRRIA